MPDGRHPDPVHIGTPLSPSATKVMLLGSGELGKEVAIALQRLGVEMIAVDRYPHAPGHQVAHRAHVIAMTDGAALRRLIEQERPQLVVPEIEAIASDALESIERDGIARVIPNARAVRLTMNREGIRRLAAEGLGLPTSAYRFADTLEALAAAIATTPGIGYPCVVKPVMSSSGKGDSVWFSEVSARPHDTGMVTMATQVQSEFELHARAILGLPVDVRMREPGASAVIYGGVEGRGIRYDDVAHALAVPGSDLRLFGKPEAYKRRRMGVALATGDDVGQARERAKECARRVKPRV